MSTELIVIIVIGVVLGLIALGQLYKMYVQPFILKSSKKLEVIADNDTFTCAYNKQSKKLRITYKPRFANSGKTAVQELISDFSKVDFK